VLYKLIIADRVRKDGIQIVLTKGNVHAIFFSASGERDKRDNVRTKKQISYNPCLDLHNIREKQTKFTKRVVAKSKNNNNNNTKRASLFTIIQK